MNQISKQDIAKIGLDMTVESKPMELRRAIDEMKGAKS